MKCQVASLTLLHHTMLSTSSRTRMKSWERRSFHSNSTKQPYKTRRQACSRTCQAPLLCHAVWRWQPYWAELPFVNPGITKAPTSQLESAHVTPDHMKGNSSHARGISPLSAAPCSPAQRCYFTLPQGEREGSVGTQGHGEECPAAWTFTLYAVGGQHGLVSREGAQQSSTWADALHACASIGLFQPFQLWFILPWVFVYKPVLCSAQPGISNTHIPAISWFPWSRRTSIWEVQVLVCRKCICP